MRGSRIYWAARGVFCEDGCRAWAVKELEAYMTTFIVTWNPDKWFWDPAERSALVRRSASAGQGKDRWSTGNRKSGITPEQDRVFLLKQGPEPRGLVASGWFTSDPYEGPHWDHTPNKLANYADISWDVVVEDDDLLPLGVIKATVSTLDWDHLLAGGVRLAPPGDEVLERLWSGKAGGAGIGQGAGS